MPDAHGSVTDAGHPDPASFGTRLAQVRKRAHFTREDLAHAAGLTYGTIARLEQDKHKPDGQTLEKLAVALHVSTDYLLGFTRHADVRSAVVGDTIDRHEVSPLPAIAVERTNQ
jgi:transcriptional regulator with XRE-family HTH domain